jgi:hypothetical protein
MRRAADHYFLAVAVKQSQPFTIELKVEKAVSYLVRGEKHRKRAEFALHGVEHHAEGFERNDPEQNAIFSFSENNRGRALTAIEAEQHITDFTCDFGTVSQSEDALGVWTDTKPAEQGRRDNRIDGSRVH